MISQRADIEQPLSEAAPTGCSLERILEGPDNLAEQFNLFFIDFSAGGGVQIIRDLRRVNRNAVCVPIVSGDLEREAVEAIRCGAFDYQLWPARGAQDLQEMWGRCLEEIAPAQRLPSDCPPRIGAYHVIQRLGIGGMAEIFLARTQGEDERVVIKRVLAEHVRKQEYLDMFLDEARISLMLSHPNIVRVTDSGADGGQHYLVMEYIRGWNLQQICTRADWQIPPGIASYIAAEVCAGLHHAHTLTDRQGSALGLVHRDINPPNILVSTTGAVKIADFGIAKAKRRYAETVDGVFKGKLAYISPEQAVDAEIDHRVDIFCVGVMLYELLTGKTPFGGRTPTETLENAQRGICEPPSVLRPELDPDMDQIVLRAISANPRDRHATALELEEALRFFLRRYAGISRSDFSRWLFRVAESQPLVGLPQEMLSPVQTRHEESSQAAVGIGPRGGRPPSRDKAHVTSGVEKQPSIAEIIYAQRDPQLVAPPAAAPVAAAAPVPQNPPTVDPSVRPVPDGPSPEQPLVSVVRNPRPARLASRELIVTVGLVALLVAYLWPLDAGPAFFNPLEAARNAGAHVVKTLEKAATIVLVEPEEEL